MNAQQSFAARGREVAAPGVVLERCRDGREARRRLLVLRVAVARRHVPRAVVVAIDHEAALASLAFCRRRLHRATPCTALQWFACKRPQIDGNLLSHERRTARFKDRCVCLRPRVTLMLVQLPMACLGMRLTR